MKISNIKVSGLIESIVASALPLKAMNNKEFEKEVKDLKSDFIEKGYFEAVKTSKHWKRIKRLGSAEGASGHDCFLKGINVSFFIEYPVYWSPQLQRYHFIDFVSSSSTMHTLDKMNFNELEISENNIKELEELRRRWKEESDPKTKYCFFESIMKRLPQGQKKVAYMTTNYLQLKTIIKQRKFHKLKEWKYFCDKMLSECPLLKELINE